ncbi:MAG: TlpA family protein disulfide reductase [Alloprevotella sp.]|nr:TlpA family protein disulfide reductase [Alloprevotella sp.]
MKKISLLVTVLLVVCAACTQKAPADTVVPEQPSQEAVAEVNVRTVPASVRGAKEILNAITANYKGSVVLIDFWATWCPPCRRAMVDIDQIKPELAEKGAAFVYVTGETSPASDWEAAVKNIKGDHYRLTNAQWNDLASGLGMPGIPAYLLLNRDGSTAFSNVTQGGYPGNDFMREQMLKALGR